MSLLIALKPTKVKNDVEAKFSHKSGKMEVVSTRYKTRVMRTSGQQVDSSLVYSAQTSCIDVLS